MFSNLKEEVHGVRPDEIAMALHVIVSTKLLEYYL